MKKLKVFTLTSSILSLVLSSTLGLFGVANSVYAEKQKNKPQSQHKKKQDVKALSDSGLATDASSRVALVIGNKDYKDAPLDNPVNDAKDMKAALESIGFKVVYRENADLPQMDAAVQEFRRNLTSNSIGLVYYSGHGIQADGANYLVPVRASIASKAELKSRGYDAGILLAEMEEVGNPVNILILDACRNNPFRGFRGGERGLTGMSGPKGSLIAFATAPNSVAQDGTGRNGLYTKYLKQLIVQPGLRVQDLFIKVREAVLAESPEQTPWENSSITGTLCLAGCNGSTVQSVKIEVQQNISSSNASEKSKGEQSATVDIKQEVQNPNTNQSSAAEINQDSQKVGDVTGSKNVIQNKVDGDVNINMGN